MIVISEFPAALEINEILYDRVCENLEADVVANPSVPNGNGSRRTDWDLHKRNINEIDKLISWIHHILPEVSKRFAEKTYDEKTIYGFNINSFVVAVCWGVHYNKNESIIEHNHFPYALSFIYYVRTPEGAAPVIVGDKAYEVKEGQCVFFLASEWHGVEQNNCQGRCAIVGNIMWDTK